MGTDTPNFLAGEHRKVVYKLKLPLIDGSYNLGVNIVAADQSHYYDRLESALTFQVVDSVNAKGIVDLEASIEFQDGESLGGKTQRSDVSPFQEQQIAELKSIERN
jgi:hypothetical protein